MSCRSSRTAVRSMSSGDGMPEPGWSTAAAPHASAFDERVRALAAAGQEAGQHRVARADRAERGDRRACDRGWRRRRRRARRRRRRGWPAPLLAPRSRSWPAASTTSAIVNSRLPVASASSSPIRLDSVGPAARTASSAGPLVSMATDVPEPASEVDEVGIDVGRRPGRQAAARDEPVGRGDGRLHGAKTAASSSALNSAPGSLNFVVVPSGSTTVMFERIAPRIGTAHDLDPGVAQERTRWSPSAPPSVITAACGGRARPAPATR